MAASEADAAAHLIERLLAEPAFRARFRRDPATTCREAGLEQLAEEMTLGAGKAMMTLDVRESKSSLAGVVMAAAMEGIGLYELSEHVLPHLEDVPADVGDVLSRINLPSVGGALAPSPPTSQAAVAAPPEEAAAPEAAPPEAPAPPEPREAPPEKPAKPEPVAQPAASPVDPAALGAEGTGGPPTAEAQALLKNDNIVLDETGKADLAEGRIDPRVVAVLTKLGQEHKITVSCMCSDHSKFTSGGSVSNHHYGRGVDIAAVDGVPVNASNFDAREIAMTLQDLDPSIRPTEIGTPWAIAGTGYFTDAGHQDHLHVGFDQAIGADWKPPADLAAGAPQAPPAPPPVEPSPAPAAPIDPGQFGAEGTGGSPSAETQALLKNDNVVFDSTGKADLQAGRIDPRVVAVLSKLSQDHKITVSCMCSDHSKFTSGGSVSNHHYGRGVDIAAVDGVPVNASNFDAREIAMELQEFDTSIRPDEIGTPWAISGRGYFTDAGHQDHLHVGFKQQITPDWKPPGAVAAASEQVAAAPERRAGDSLTFAAVKPKAAAAGAGKATGSLSFIRAVEGQPAASAPPVVEVAGYPGDGASQAQIAAWMASEARKRGLPPELPVMASLVESGLKNLNYGHADSVGFFQMRLSIWNKGATFGYAGNPQKQIDWFLDQAEGIKAQRVARGQPIDDPNHYGEWIADIERPAEQFRYRYQLKLDQARGLLKDAPEAPPPPVEVVAPVGGGAAGAKALAALTEAKKHLGTPYQWGGSTPETNFDCSGLVQWSYAQAGIQIPRVTDQQILADNGTEVKRNDLLPGDLVFFRDPSGYVHHVGMSLGGDKFIHAPHTGDVVKISSLDESYYAEQFAGGRRFAEATAGAPADPTDVAKAQAHVALDAAEVRREDSLLFVAVKAQEAAKARATVQFMKAIDPSQSKGSPAAAPPELAAQAPAGPKPDLAGVPSDYPGDDAPKAELAKWLAKRAEKAGLPPELPVMAAIVESGVKNLNYGHADSVGFFQMRLSIWNRGATFGYPDRPELQAKWFIDTALAVKKQRIAAGDVNFGKDPSKWGEWIADIERPAEQFRGRYQLRLAEARTLLR